MHITVKNCKNVRKWNILSIRIEDLVPIDLLYLVMSITQVITKLRQGNTSRPDYWTSNLIK